MLNDLVRFLAQDVSSLMRSKTVPNSANEFHIRPTGGPKPRLKLSVAGALGGDRDEEGQSGARIRFLARRRHFSGRPL
jgi:hypothetical protein